MSHIIIELEEFKKLMDSLLFLECLETAGVANWKGYEEAQRIYGELEEDAEEALKTIIKTQGEKEKEILKNAQR